ncbi:MAG: hypothetical protein C4326_04810 [Ignavibacteria bacterium]|mgnify:CR=1 FL=1
MIARKKSPHQIDRAKLVEPSLSEEEWKEYRTGWELFNHHRFWDAHEAWESVWKRRYEESRIFFQGIIQLAAAYHLLTVKHRFGGMMRNFEKAEEKLALFPSSFLGCDVRVLLQAIAAARSEVRRIGSDNLAAFDRSLIPTVQLRSHPLSHHT